MAFCKTRAALAILSVALIAACGDSGPSQFDASAMGTDIETFGGVSDNSIFQAFDGVSASLGGTPAVVSVGRLASRPIRQQDARTVAATLRSSISTPAISASLAIPPEAAGKVWVYDDATGEYVASDRTGAPANGIRVILYEQDAEGQFVTPLVETGYVDLTDLSSGSTSKARLVAVVGSATIMDYTVQVTGDETSGELAVAGYLVFPAGRLNVDFAANASTNDTGTSTFDMTSSLDMPSRDFSFDLHFNGNYNDDAATGTFVLSETITSPNGRLDLTASAGYSDAFTFTIKVNGDTWATYDGETLTATDGRTLSSDESDVLESAAGVSFLGLFIPLRMFDPIIALAGGGPPLPL